MRVLGTHGEASEVLRELPSTYGEPECSRQREVGKESAQVEAELAGVKNSVMCGVENA